MDHVISYPLILHMGLHEIPELTHIGKQAFLGKMACRASWHMDHPNVFLQFNLCRKVGAVQSREHIDAMPQARQFTRHIGDIDILSAAIHATQLRQGRGMFTNDCNPLHTGSPRKYGWSGARSPLGQKCGKRHANHMPAAGRADRHSACSGTVPTRDRRPSKTGDTSCGNIYWVRQSVCLWHCRAKPAHRVPKGHRAPGPKAPKSNHATSRKKDTMTRTSGTPVSVHRRHDRQQTHRILATRTAEATSRRGHRPHRPRPNRVRARIARPVAAPRDRSPTIWMGKPCNKPIRAKPRRSRDHRRRFPANHALPPPPADTDVRRPQHRSWAWPAPRQAACFPRAAVLWIHHRRARSYPAFRTEKPGPRPS